jgi:hypothetical protein
MKTMRSKANRRSARTIIQFILGGGLTALVAVMTQGLSSRETGLILAVVTVTVTWTQNYAEDHEIIPVILPTPSKDNP